MNSASVVLAREDAGRLLSAKSITVADVDASIDRVRRHAESIWDEWAWQVENRTWLVKGYGSWDEMRSAEYASLTNVTAPRAERRELVVRFRAAGLTQVETARTLGVSDRTVRNEEPEDLRGTRGPEKTGKVAGFTPDDDVIEAEIVGDAPADADTGEVLDNPHPPAPRRRAITESARDIAHDLRKTTERLQRLAADDRYTRNKGEAAAILHHHLIFTIETCQGILDGFTPTGRN